MRSKNSIIDFPSDYVVIDLETTGFSPTFDSIIEIAAIRYRNDNPVAEFSSLINPEIEIPINIQYLTGISDEDVSDCPTINDVISEYVDFIGNDIIIGHNVGFDINFINKNFKKGLDNNYINTVRISHKLNPALESHSLSSLKDLYKIEALSHRALGDCESTALVFQKMKVEILSNSSFEEFKKLFRNKGYTPNLKMSDIKTDNTEFDEDNFFFNKKTVFTGKLERYTRREAAQLVVDLGGMVSNTISSKTDILVVGDMDYSSALAGRITSKHKKATELQQQGSNITIMSESDFIELLN
jgi:DNA polymerase-3 subunit epsilon